MQVQLGAVGQTNVADPAYNQAFAPTEAQVAGQPPNVSEAIRMAQANARVKQTKAELQTVTNSVSCQANPQTSLFSCSVTSHDPVFAQVVANDLARAFILNEENWGQSRYQQVLTQIQAQEKATRDPATLASLEQARTNVLLNAAQGATIVRTVSPAQVPPGPSSPHPTLNAALAFAAIMTLVLVIGVISDRLDDSVRGEEEIKQLTGLPILGAIPSIDSLKERRVSPNSLVVSHDQRSPATEAFRVVRAGIEFSRIDEPPRVLLVTSAFQGDGKSTFASNIACAFAEGGKSVILIDLDLRRPALSSIVDTPVFGLTNLLLNPNGKPESYLVSGTIPGLRVLPSGPIPPSPVELLSSLRMKQIIAQLRSVADIVIIDSPPILAAADATIAASLCDSAVLVVRPDRVKRRILVRAVEALQSVNVRLIGLVINGVARTDSTYYSYGHFYDYQPVASRNGAASGGIPLVTPPADKDREPAER
jgi:capsular exopolysaccharide synthesis family protein